MKKNLGFVETSAYPLPIINEALDCALCRVSKEEHFFSTGTRHSGDDHHLLLIIIIAPPLFGSFSRGNRVFNPCGKSLFSFVLVHPPSAVHRRYPRVCVGGGVVVRALGGEDGARCHRQREGGGVGGELGWGDETNNVNRTQNIAWEDPPPHPRVRRSPKFRIFPRCTSRGTASGDP